MGREGDGREIGRECEGIQKEERRQGGASEGRKEIRRRKIVMECDGRSVSELRRRRGR